MGDFFVILRAFPDPTFRGTFDPKSGLSVPGNLNKRPYDSTRIFTRTWQKPKSGLFDQLLTQDFVKRSRLMPRDLYGELSTKVQNNFVKPSVTFYDQTKTSTNTTSTGLFHHDSQQTMSKLTVLRR